jgi:hypothetical protein
MSILSQNVFDPLKSDLDPLLADLFAAINAAAQSYLVKSAATSSLGPVVGIVSDVGLQVATQALNNALGVTPPTAAATVAPTGSVTTVTTG